MLQILLMLVIYTNMRKIPIFLCQFHLCQTHFHINSNRLSRRYYIRNAAVDSIYNMFMVQSVIWDWIRNHLCFKGWIVPDIEWVTCVTWVKPLQMSLFCCITTYWCIITNLNHMYICQIWLQQYSCCCSKKGPAPTHFGNHFINTRPSLINGVPVWTNFDCYVQRRK